MVKLFANSGDPDQTPRSAASDLGLHCLPITLLEVSRLQWVKQEHKGMPKNWLLKTGAILMQIHLHLFSFTVNRVDFTVNTGNWLPAPLP